jgi:hypothetical protein
MFCFVISLPDSLNQAHRWICLVLSALHYQYDLPNPSKFQKLDILFLREKQYRKLKKKKTHQMVIGFKESKNQENIGF